MVWIQSTVERTTTVRATKAAILDVVMDVPRSGRWFPGIDAIRPEGDDVFDWTLATRRTLGTSFTGQYRTKYTRHGDEAASWESLGGNMSVKGRWQLSGIDGHVFVRLTVTTELDAPVPKILKKPAELFARKEAGDGLAEQLKRLKTEMERA